jgi:hypothetical protein
LVVAHSFAGTASAKDRIRSPAGIGAAHQPRSPMSRGEAAYVGGPSVGVEFEATRRLRKAWIEFNLVQLMRDWEELGNDPANLAGFEAFAAARAQAAVAGQRVCQAKCAAGKPEEDGSEPIEIEADENAITCEDNCKGLPTKEEVKESREKLEKAEHASGWNPWAPSKKTERIRHRACVGGARAACSGDMPIIGNMQVER